MKVNHHLLSMRRNRQYCAIEQLRAFLEGTLGPIEREQRRLEALRFIGEQMHIATRMGLPEGPIRLSAQEAIDFIARHVPKPEQDDKYRRHAILRVLSVSHRWIEWTPTVYEALINVALPLRVSSLGDMLHCAKGAFKMSAQEVVSAICSEAALDPKRRAEFDAFNDTDIATYDKMRQATPGLQKACVRYLCRSIHKKFANPAGPA